MKKAFFLAVAQAFCLGAFSCVALPPLSLWPFILVGLSGLYVLLARAPSYTRAFGVGWGFGFGYFVFGLYWIGNALLVEGNAYAWAWPIAVMGLPFVLAFFPALACLAARPLGFLGFVGMMALAEWLRGHIFTGLPWNLYGMAWAEVPAITQSVALADIYFLTFLTLFWMALVGVLVAREGSRAYRYTLLAVGVATFAGAYAFGAMRLAANPTTYNEKVRFRVVQPNIAQAEKWTIDKMPTHFQKQVLLSYPLAEPKAHTYIVWPETALIWPYLEEADMARSLSAMLRTYRGGATLLTGFLEEEGPFAYNSLAVVDAKAHLLHRYDKAHLVPFGEYMPFAWLGGPMSAAAKDAFTQGAGPQVLETPQGLRIVPLVCYEVIFSGAIMSTQTADVLVNVTNDTWYGRSAGPYQHFAQARMRSIEEGLPLVRSANAGISGVVDPLGRVLVQTDLFESRAVESFLPRAVAPPFAWSKIQLWRDFIFFFCISICCGLAGVFRVCTILRKKVKTYT